MGHERSLSHSQMPVTCPFPQPITEPTYSIENSISWEGGRFLASQEIPRIFEPKRSVPHSKVPANCTYPERIYW